MSEIYTDPPQSRNEAIIKATIDGTEYTAPPQSRMEDLLLELKEAIEQGGGGGTSDYPQLSNKPSINDVTLIGNKTASDLGLMNHYDIDTTPTEDSDNLITSGGVWTADKNINNKLQGSKTAGSTDGSPFEIPDYGMTESIQMYFKPTQDLHGYDKPWAGGAGKNKCPAYTSTDTQHDVTITGNNEGEISVNGTLDGTNLYGFVLNSSTSLGAGTYTLNGANPNGARLVLYDSNDNVLADTQDANPTFTLESATTAVLRMFVYANVQYDEVVRPMIRLSTETDATFEPYSNICPISGQNNATFEWTGKNLFDKDDADVLTGYGLNSETGTTYLTTAWSVSNYIEIEPSTTYTLNSMPSGNNSVVFYDAEKAYISGDSTFGTKITPSNAKYLRFDYKTEYSAIMQLELGNQATSYEPYTHEERTMNFGNTYYGGFCQFNGQIYPDWDYIASYNGETLSGEWVSDRDEYQAGTTPTIGAEVAYKTTPSYVRVTPPANLNLTDDYPIEYNGYMASISYQPKNTVLAEAKRYTNQEIAKLGLPQPPTTDGTYHLECSVSGGIPTIRWVSNS